MAIIEDTGKVWFKGAFGPEYALRVGDKVFVPGKGENDILDCLIINNSLCVDLHDTKAGKRIGRYFPMDLPAGIKATLFNGFENTRHADVLMVTYKDEGVREVTVDGEDYRKESISAMETQRFFKWITDNKSTYDASG